MMVVAVGCYQERNKSIALMNAGVEMARQNVVVVGSRMKPQVGANFRLAGTRDEGHDQWYNSQSALAGVSWEPDVWGRLRQQKKAARAQLKSSEWDYRTVTITMVGDVTTGYFNLLALDMDLEIVKRTLAARQEFLRLTTARQQGGLATMLEVRQAEQLVYEASQIIPDTERQIEQMENQISLLLGNNPGPISRGATLTQQRELPSVPAGLPSSLLERRPDIQSAEQQLISENALVYAVKASYFPRISLTGDFGFQSNQLSSLFTGPSRIWSFVPEVTAPIFTAGRRKSDVNFQRAQREFALAQYQQTIRTAFQEVSDALVQYRRVREIRTQQELLVKALRDASRLAYLRYEGGVDTLLNALIADTSLFDAELSLAETRLNELLSLVQLYKALGGGWE
jgi:multidrug efflux system outer membrane protein